MAWKIRCYSETQPKIFNNLNEAQKSAENHIKETCPWGHMPWAQQITWNPTIAGYSASANSEWLNHYIKEIDHGLEVHLSQNR